MNEVYFLDNPRRKHRRRRTTVKRKRSRRTRRHISVNPVTTHHERRLVMSHRRRRSRRGHRRFRHNPPALSGVRSSIGGMFKQSLVGAAGILANNFISSQLGGLLGSTTIPGLGSPKGLVKIALPVVAGLTVGKKNPTVRAAASVALSVALIEALKPMLPAGFPGLSGADAQAALLPQFSQDAADRPDISGYDTSFSLPSSIAQ